MASLIADIRLNCLDDGCEGVHARLPTLTEFRKVTDTPRHSEPVHCCQGAVVSTGTCGGFGCTWHEAATAPLYDAPKTRTQTPTPPVRNARHCAAVSHRHTRARDFPCPANADKAARTLLTLPAFCSGHCNLPHVRTQRCGGLSTSSG